MQDTTIQQATLLIKLHEKSSQELQLASDNFTIGRKSLVVSPLSSQTTYSLMCT